MAIGRRLELTDFCRADGRFELIDVFFRWSKTMINVYTKTDNGLEQMNELMPGTWVHLIDPQRAEVERVLAATNIPEDFVTAALDEDERARTDREDNATLIILRVPHLFSLEDSIPYRTVPFGMILCPGYLITVCKYHTGISLDLLRYRIKGLSTTKHPRPSGDVTGFEPMTARAGIRLCWQCPRPGQFPR